MKRSRLVVLAFTLAGLSLLAGFTEIKSPGSRSTANKLLDESFALSAQIEDSSRVFYLLSLTQAGAKSQHPREQEWCNQMFQAAQNVRDPWDRVALEKNAVAALSRVNPTAAMDLFWRVEAPAADERGNYPEDVRADAAAVVFPRYFEDQIQTASAKGSESRIHSALDEIHHHAIQIAQTGEYPYRAMASVIKKLAQKKDEQSDINLIFTEAVRFYSETKPKFRNRHAEFLVLLQTAIDTVSDPVLIHAAIDQFVKNMKVPAVLANISFEAEYRTQAGEIVKFNDRDRSLLFRALPSIRKADPGLAKSLDAEFANFNRASENMTYISGGVVEGSFSAQETAAMHARMRQIAVLSLIQARQQNNPAEATKLIEELSDGGLRVVAVASTVPGLMLVDPNAAKAAYNDQRSKLQDISDNRARLAATIALAKAASAADKHGDFRSLATEAFSEATEIYRADYRERPDIRPDLRKGYSELSDLATFTATHDLGWLIELIRSIQNIELRAHLLTFAADAIADGDRAQP
jgi:hypothetical protein